ncbi:hypothetical protein RHGRI_018433 [Rhododendron griersonianum]|uniref:Uncharacterized protein n=1 Tax=Rhododendron griersonianum TaxID=479676 RepID=A0AAV6IE91_9ERIC|nr:hypothetical protein RHGRI_028068 [Rhododendron griersonianum]KAG5546254.1 hypothetical protein RHGRI_018433 [Rhododendron griersonianum]
MVSGDAKVKEHDVVVRLYIYQGGRRLLPDYKLQRGPSSREYLFVFIFEVFPTVSLNFAGGASMILYLEDYLLRQNSIAGVVVWCIGFQKIDDQEINDFKRYMFVRKVKSVAQFNSNMDSILGLESVVCTKLPRVVWEYRKESMKCNSS